MKKNLRHFITGVFLTLAISVFLFPASSFAAKKRLAFSGGPDGGTFQFFSNAVAIRLSKNIADM
jgi:hypothetical protein